MRPRKRSRCISISPYPASSLSKTHPQCRKWRGAFRFSVYCLKQIRLISHRRRIAGQSTSLPLSIMWGALLLNCAVRLKLQLRRQPLRISSRFLNALARSSWAGVAMITIIMLLIGLAAHRIGMTVLTRLARTRAIPSIMLRAIHSPTRYLLVLCALQMAWQEVPPKLSLIVWLRDMSGFALIGVLSWFGMRMVMAAGETITYLHPIDVSDNLNARRIHTQVRVLTRIVMAIVGLIGLSSILMLFPAVHRIGATLLASAGVVGLAAGIAARPVLGNLIAGLQIALTQPIRLDDVVIVAEEWGRIEEIHSSYVVVRLWDQRRL